MRPYCLILFHKSNNGKGKDEKYSFFLCSCNLTILRLKHWSFAKLVESRKSQGFSSWGLLCSKSKTGAKDGRRLLCVISKYFWSFIFFSVCKPNSYNGERQQGSPNFYLWISWSSPRRNGLILRKAYIGQKEKSWDSLLQETYLNTKQAFCVAWLACREF